VHVHLTPHLCLEVQLLRGKAKEIKMVADGLIATKGVEHGRLVLTAVGQEGH
jgi:CopG family transcriptional regulator, nickel-responsive regulator